MNRKTLIVGVIALLLIVLSLWQLGFFGGSYKTDAGCLYRDIERGGPTKIRVFSESMSMTPDGIVGFSMMNGVGNNPVNITNMTIIYIGEKCEKEIICQIQNFQGNIEMKKSEVLEITAHCPDVQQNAGTETRIYMEKTYRVIGYEPTHTEVRIHILPVE